MSRALLSAASILLCFCSTQAQTPNNRTTRPNSSQTAGITREQADAILSELKQIRQLLQTAEGDSPSAVARGTHDLRLKLDDTWNALGSPDAPVTLVEFADYQCPFCRRFHQESFAQLKAPYIDTGKVRFVALDLPLQTHPNALGAAYAARCAGQQGRYWEMRDALISHSEDLSRDALIVYAKQVGVDPKLFEECTSGNRYDGAVTNDTVAASQLSLSATPSFYLAKTGKSELVGEAIIGAQPYSVFDNAIKRLLDPALEKRETGRPAE
jgi:protein-disulfide isomerase